MNWGTAITIVIIAFMSFILYLVIGISSVDIDLEYEDYYQKELAFEDQISASKNQSEANYLIDIISSNNQIEVRFKNMSNPEKIEGQIHFFRPSNASKDKIYELKGTVSKTGKVIFPRDVLSSGKYIVKISYTINNKNYFSQQNLYI